LLIRPMLDSTRPVTGCAIFATLLAGISLPFLPFALVRLRYESLLPPVHLLVQPVLIGAIVMVLEIGGVFALMFLKGGVWHHPISSIHKSINEHWKRRRVWYVIALALALTATSTLWFTEFVKQRVSHRSLLDEAVFFLGTSIFLSTPIGNYLLRSRPLSRHDFTVAAALPTFAWLVYSAITYLHSPHKAAWYSRGDMVLLFLVGGLTLFLIFCYVGMVSGILVAALIGPCLVILSVALRIWANLHGEQAASPFGRRGEVAFNPSFSTRYLVNCFTELVLAAGWLAVAFVSVDTSTLNSPMDFLTSRFAIIFIAIFSTVFPLFLLEDLHIHVGRKPLSPKVTHVFWSGFAILVLLVRIITGIVFDVVDLSQAILFSAVFMWGSALGFNLSRARAGRWAQKSIEFMQRLGLLSFEA